MVLYTDGGCRKNLKREAAAATILTDGKEVIQEDAWYLGDRTNNRAEYAALLCGMKLARQHGTGELVCISDSQLMIKQLRGEYQVKSPKLMRLYHRAKELEVGFDLVIYIHVNREHPMIQRADAMVNRVLDEKMREK